MAGAGVKIQAVKLLQLFNTVERGGSERALAIEGVEHNSFQQITQGQVVILGEGFEHFQQALFDADAGLNALDGVGLVFGHVPMYHGTKTKTSAAQALPTNGRFLSACGGSE